MKKLSIAWATLVAIVLVHGGSTAADMRKRMLGAMEQELRRSMEKLRLPGFEGPYFVAMEMKEEERFYITARFGALFNSNHDRYRRLRVEVRVGSYEFDNIGERKQAYGFAEMPTYNPPRQGPLDDDPIALRAALWLMTDSAYKQALQAYLKRKSKKITEVDEGKPKLSFTREKKSIYLQPSAKFAFAMERWQSLARQASAVFERHPDVFDSSVTVDARRVERMFVNSEGTRLATWRTIYQLSIFGVTRASDGQLIRHTRTVYSRQEGKMPSVQQVTAMAEQLARDLEALKKAPKIDPYTGPAILDGEATGVLFHEVIGHRLEGERQLDEREGKTFKGHLGKQVIPKFLSVIDDPTMRRVGDVELNGFYRYDDEGVAARRVVLIDRGILKTFLLSRTPVEDFTHSNGHGRAAAGMRPRARMANTIVQSNKKVPYTELKKMLIEEVEKQQKPYGLIIKNIVGGSTHTYNWGYQAYKGVPEMVYRVYPDGREELVRGVEIVGTPLASINKIIATSDNVSVFNGYCGAESGYVPVSTAAPDVLMTEIELQRSMKQSEKPPILPSPWNATSKTSSR